LIPHSNSVYNALYLPTSMDLQSVFMMDKIQDQSVSTTYRGGNSKIVNNNLLLLFVFQ
jgi:hypothetical protein